jgi:predicted N-acetyltransferase YhbS
MAMRLRPTTAADIPRLHDIEMSAAALFAGSDLIDMDDTMVVATTDHLAAIEAGLSLVAEVDGRAAGFVMGEVFGADAYLHELDVDLAYQQRGIGAALVRGFADAARATGASAVVLSTFRDPPWNAPFYRRMGFEDVERANYLPWMVEIETQQAEFLDIATRVFMRLSV